ncbi:MAG: BPL-N domain-containing protein [Desulfovibrionales bacterium]
MSIPCRWIRSRDIARGLLDSVRPKALLVPGGWAKLKSESLGQEGRREIRRYVSQGGAYIGFCGGAGLALKEQGNLPGLGLCSWKRRTFPDCLPNFSGHIHATVRPDDRFLKSAPESDQLLPVWWPPQIAPDGTDEQVSIVAAYTRPGPDFWVADLELGSLSPEQIGEWENLYGIRLSPALLQNEACIISGRFGQGRYLLSYSHLETPQSPQSNQLLSRLLTECCDMTSPQETQVPLFDPVHGATHWDNPEILRAARLIDEIFRTGEKNFLLFWREPWLLGWRRGIPGPALNTLILYIHALRCTDPAESTVQLWEEKSRRFMPLLERFQAEMLDYLRAERFVLSTSPSSPEASSSARLQLKREHLVGKFPGYGGMYAELVHVLDDLFWTIIASR